VLTMKVRPVKAHLLLHPGTCFYQKRFSQFYTYL
jgi:hypothetical protein